MNAEYKYFKSASIAALAFSVFDALPWPRPKLDQNEFMPDMTLRTLETECRESLSLRFRAPGFGFDKNDT